MLTAELPGLASADFSVFEKSESRFLEGGFDGMARFGGALTGAFNKFPPWEITEIMKCKITS